MVISGLALVSACSGSTTANRRSASPPPVSPPSVSAQYTAAGPYGTTIGSAIVWNENAFPSTYTLFYPSNYSALGFESPIVTWGNGTGGTPPIAYYTSLLSHFASYGFTVIASNLGNTGSGRDIDAAAHYLVAQNANADSVFYGHLDVHHVAAVGHSQGATGATNAATTDPGLITALMTFSLPDREWSLPNPDCQTAADCTPHPAKLTQPAFFISTHGYLDSKLHARGFPRRGIASPRAETAYYNSVKGQACIGIITNSGTSSSGTREGADHNTVTDPSSPNHGNPEGELGYATAWLEYTLLGNATAKTAFIGAHPQLVHDNNWPGSACKQ
jgi:pimeloyl-ACP methyl ester carboxylesterase